MAIMLYLIPLFAILSGFLIYRHNGRREFMQLDLIQFLYTFILAPLFFLWAKTFIFFLLRSEATISLSTGQLFTIDTAFSLFLFYMYAFIVMHSLTKTFRLNTERDPLYDLFHHSEYIHLWLTHIVTGIGSMVLLIILAIVNIYFPLLVAMSKPVFYLVCAAGILAGSVSFVGLWLTDPRQNGRRYMRLMKLAIGISFIILTTAYFIVTPSFDSRYGLYWFIFFTFSTMLVWSFFTYRSLRMYEIFSKFANKNKDTQWWGINSQLFKTSEDPKTKG
jgi:hypothetical protein